MVKKRFCAAVLTASLIAGLGISASAAPRSSFSDLTDEGTAVNADVLRLMGVVDGVGDNRFNPDANLTRAEFCVMVTKFIQRGHEVTRYASRTIFSDVTGQHWARGYINLMASPVGDAPAMISGIGDGSFAPNQKVTVAQAITVLLRVLGYTSEDTGFIWPASYMALAESIGLLDGIPSDAHTVITRGQAAQLFVNALGCDTKGGQDYYESLGSVSKDTILLAVNVASDDGSSNSAIRTSLGGEAFLPASGEVSPVSLQGKRGALVLNEQDEIVTFLPDNSNSITITLSDNAQPSYLKGTNGTRYTMSASTMLYTAVSEEGSNYIDGYSSLHSGNQVTLFTKSGKVTAVYTSGSTSSLKSGAVVVKDKASYALFNSLTGGATNCKIIKNRQVISMNDIKPYDVVTYDELNNTLIVSDLRIVGIYEDASPNPSAPISITALGTEFNVLDSAWDYIEQKEIGNSVSLLLTADGMVAGIMQPTAKVRSTAVAYVNGNSVDVFLPNGNTLTLQGTLSDSEKHQNQLVTVSSSRKGLLTTSQLSSKGSVGTLDFNAMTLGKLPISSAVRIYEKTNGTAMVNLALEDLRDIKINSERVESYYTNTSGYIDYLVLNNVTGNSYFYGICQAFEDDAGIRHLRFENGVAGQSQTLETNYYYSGRDFAGLALGIDGKVKSITRLNKLNSISSSDFFDHNGKTYLRAAGEVYAVSNDVVCYRKNSNTWFEQESGAARLTACRAFSDKFTVYLDPFSQQVRIISAE